MCIKLCLTLLTPLFPFLYQEADEILSDTGRDCQQIASSDKILDENMMINLVFSGLHFSQIVTGHHEDLQFFQAQDCLS